MYNKIEENYYGDESDYKDEIIQPLFYPNYPDETGHLDKKWFKVYLSPDLNAMDDDGEDYSPQFWGQSAYGIVINQYIGLTDSINPDAISLAQFKAITEDRRHQATDWGVKLNTTRSYSTYTPAVIGYDPIREGYWASLTNTIGGTSSMTDGRRDHSFDYFNETISLNIDTPSGIIQQFHFDAEGYEIDEPTWETGYDAYTQPPCFLNYLEPNVKASDLHVYLVICHTFNYPVDFDNQYQMCWVIYSERSDYYKIIPALPSFSGLDLPYGEPTNEPEGEDETMPIEYPDVQDNMVVNSGYLEVYKMSVSQVQSLADDMWDDSILSQVGHMFGENPNYSEVIVNLGILPYPDDIASGTETPIGIGNTTAPTATGFPISYRTYNSFFKDGNDMLEIPKIHDSFLDYAPYTSVTMFLPFIGYVQVPPQFIIGHSIEARYTIDVVTGGCTVCLKNDEIGVFAVHTGTCMYSIPLSQSRGGHWYDAIQSAVTGGLSLGGSSFVSTANNVTSAGSTMVEVAQHAWDTHTTIKGNVGGTNGFSAYLEEIPIWIETTRRVDTGDYISTKGVPVAQTMELQECSGFTIVESINLRGISATKPELEELDRILKTGFIAPTAGGAVVQPSYTLPTSGRVTIDCYSRFLGVNELNVAGGVSSISINHQGAFREHDTASITDPTIIVNANMATLANCNYVHITEFNRYYFVTGMVALTDSTTQLLLHVDVLNSFWHGISNKSAYIGRMNTETEENPYIVDSCAVLGSNQGEYEKDVYTYELTHPHTQGVHGAYVLLTASHPNKT